MEHLTKFDVTSTQAARENVLHLNMKNAKFFK